MAHSKQAIMALALKAASLYLRFKQEAYRRYSAVSFTNYEASESESLKYLALIWATFELFVVNQAAYIWEDVLNMALSRALNFTVAAVSKRPTLPKIWSGLQTSALRVAAGATSIQYPIPPGLHPNRKLLIVKMLWAAVKSLRLACQTRDHRCILYCGGIVLKTTSNLLLLAYGSLDNFLLEYSAQRGWQ